MRRRVIISVGAVSAILTFTFLVPWELSATEEVFCYYPRPAGDPDPASFVTPHVQWGKPLDGGPIRALFS
jgi:hypothetical protein